MNSVRLRWASAVVLTVTCLVLFGTQVLAAPAVLPQPNTHAAPFSMPEVWHGQGLPFGMSLKSAPLAKPPVPVPPDMPPVPAPPVKMPGPGLPVEPPAPVPPAKPPTPIPPEPALPTHPVVPPVSAPPDKSPTPVPPAMPPEGPPSVDPSAASPTAMPPPAVPTATLQPTAAISNPITMEFLIKFEAGSGAHKLAQAGVGLATRVVERIPQLGVEVVQVTTDSAERALQALRRVPGVAYVEPNYPIQIMEQPNDPDIPIQWHLEAIGAPAAWGVATGVGVVIAIVDTGVDPNEPDLKGKIVSGFDFVNEDAEPWDDQGHGTSVALIAAAAANNGYGGAGVAYDARVMPVKALSNTGSGTHAWVAKAIVWAADNGADIINLSVGGPYSSQTLQDAVSYAWRRGVLLVAAAGNESSNVPVYPAAYDQVLAVTGTTRNRQRASFSNWGDYVSVAAPGTNILVTLGGNHQAGSGTSLSTPQVAGVAALILSRNPNLNNGQVRDIIQTTASDLGSPGWDPFYGFGQVDAYRAVLRARPAAGGAISATAVVDAVNRARRSRDLPALHPDAELMASTQQRAESLIRHCASGNGPSLASCLTRGDRKGHRHEIVLIGVSSPQAVVEMLAASPEGQKLLYGPYLQIGAGYVDVGPGPLSQVWVLRFAQKRPHLQIGPPPAPITETRQAQEQPTVRRISSYYRTEVVAR